ncbi:MAG: endonuclease/exonuclease/phosphatase family protein [Kiritimatiellae bacterium]|nr:endonuclease/exonuclease/phosphatase family protein [Kiritimatiellia bacterium]
MKRATIGVCRCWVLAALCSAAVLAGANADSANAIRVGSYNIRYVAGDKGTDNDWTKRRDDLVALVRGFNLDAFGLQEVDPEQMQYLRVKMPGYGFVGEHRNADRKSGEASPVAYRKARFDLEKQNTFWLSETPEVPGSRSWGAMCRRVCTYAVLKDKITGKRLCFVNTHLDHKSELANTNGMRLILERMKEFAAGMPVVLTGDHNCYETSNTAKMATKVLRNALYVSERPPEGPWLSLCLFPRRKKLSPCMEAMKTPEKERNSNEGRKKFGARIDYIYVSQGVRVLDYRTDPTLRPGLDLYPSDHFPIIATLEL